VQFSALQSFMLTLSAHVLSLETPFVTNRKMIKIVTVIDLHIVSAYDCCHSFLVFNICTSHALEMTINSYDPTLELFCFSFTQHFTHSKFRLPNPFLFVPTENCWTALQFMFDHNKSYIYISRYITDGQETVR
jgi:hypothetical protein